jgi:hypothetical protein
MIGRGLAVEPLIGASATQYDGRKFTWLGSGSDQVSLCVTLAHVAGQNLGRHAGAAVSRRWRRLGL